MDDLDAVLPVLPSVAAALVLVLTVGLLAPARRAVPDGEPAGQPVAARSWTGGRVSGLLALLLLTALAALARFGPANELDNPASALVVGIGPLAVLLLPVLAVGRARSTDDGGPPTVWPAVPVTLAVAAYLSAVPSRAEPPRLGAALAACAVVAVAAALALGRDVVERAEPVGLLAGWAALGPRLVRWDPPGGAAAVLAIVAGAAWCERWARSEAWAGAPRDQADLWTLFGGFVLLAAALAAGLQRWSGPVAAALVPLAIGAVVAAGLRRALISGQLLLEQAGLSDRVEPDLLGTVGGQVAALSVVAVAGCLATVVVARRSGEGPDRLPALAVVLLVTAVSSTVVLQP